MDSAECDPTQYDLWSNATVFTDLNKEADVAGMVVIGEGVTSS